MFHELPNYQINDLDAFARSIVLTEAQKAVSESSYGVGGVLVSLNSGAIIKAMHNTVIARERENEQSRLKDPTAHGERQLVDWYFANRTRLGLPDPEDILIVTSLDPCLMCTGCILSAGFHVVIVSLDDNAGINWDGQYKFSPLEGDVLAQTKKMFIYPAVSGDSARTGYGNVPLFEKGVLSKAVTDDCLTAFKKGADEARSIVKSIISPENLVDVKKSSNAAVVAALKAVYPNALAYKTKTRTNIPDENLAPYLIEAAKEDIRYGGDGDAVAFLDYFGNLMMCKPGKKSESPIRSAFMETARAYQRVRYELSAVSNDLLQYLCDPSFGSFVFVKGFDKSAPSFADMGAYGSVMLNTPQAHNLQYLTPRIPHSDLLTYIGGMPERYSKTIKPEVVSNTALINAVKNGMSAPKDFERYIDIPFPKGYYLEACVSMQAGNSMTATLSDDTAQYFCYTKQDAGAKPQALSGFPQIMGDNLRLLVTIQNRAGISVKLSQGFHAVTGSAGNEKALEYSLFLEDATDNDFNDLHVTLTAWKTKG